MAGRPPLVGEVGQRVAETGSQTRVAPAVDESQVAVDQIGQPLDSLGVADGDDQSPLAGPAAEVHGLDVAIRRAGNDGHVGHAVT